MLLTASSKSPRESLKQIGIQSSVVKPPRPSDLLSAIMEALGKKTADESVPVRTGGSLPVEIGPSLKILVAEDTPFNQVFIKRLLGRWGHETLIVDNGKLALNALKEQDFDVVLMDVQMPELDGFAATREIRKAELPIGRHTPVIAMTAHAMKGDRERCIDAGMDDYVSKPISAEKLMESLRRLVPNKWNSPPGPEEKEVERPPAVDLDENAVLRAFDNDKSFLNESVKIFRKEYPLLIEGLGRAITAADSAGIERNAHALKGMLGNFRAGNAVKTAQNLENMGRNKDIADAADHFERLIAAVKEAESALIRMTGE
jgi:two-component system sensor histidine kinase/response regulator